MQPHKFCNTLSSDNGAPINSQMDSFELLSSMVTDKDFNELSNILNPSSTFPENSAELLPLPFDHYDRTRLANPTFDPLQESEHIAIQQQQNLPQELVSNCLQQQQPLPLPIFPAAHDMIVDKKLISIGHLTKAFGEAKEQENQELARVIARRLSEIASPGGEHAVERLSYYSFDVNQEAEYLKRESSKNLDAASEAFYRIFPYGIVAHFTANSAILDAMPREAKIIHVIEFDLGDGIQFSSLIEALGLQKQRILKLTLIKWKVEDQEDNIVKTKKRLYYHASRSGLKLIVKELEIQELEGELKKVKNREWLVFNCMQGLPHMKRRRSRRVAMQFLRIAKESVSISGKITTFGDGDGWGRLRKCSAFGVFFDGFMEHYQALLESMEWSFPGHLKEARTAMECLFVAPCVSCSAYMEKWEEVREGCDGELGVGLVGWRLSNWSLMEAKEMVREGHSLHRVRVEGETKNEMVLEWQGTELLRVSVWT